MRQYQVPQFIDIEDKIIGPLTLKQFMYLAVGAGLLVIFYYLFNFYIFIVLAVPIGLFSLALAFFKLNNVPFPKVVMNAIGFYTHPHLYLWKQQPAKKEGPTATPKTPLSKIPKLTESKLQDLAWSLDIKENLE
ncbi:MAG: PrgI family protein [Candidatus Sungbacteria bacterium]|uniref:PrgI family protein n=1 Tax=Candidatus Sungiibacteriota bacterium TaxID=2750080 RepID=A0A9D6LQW9_9BACT|nr:PrgI family protein [Candidatus Sungbacteria bacterium]